MRAGENFDRFRVEAVAGDAAVVVPVGADQIGQQLGVGGIGFGARDMVAVAVVRHRQRVDRIHLIAGGGQRPHPQAADDQVVDSTGRRTLLLAGSGDGRQH